MNRSLLVVSIFIMLVGAAFGFIPIILLGVLLLIGSFASAKKPAPKPQTTTQPSRPQPQRIIPPVPSPGSMAGPSSDSAAQPHLLVDSLPKSAPTLSYSPALFPTSIFPQLMGTTPPSPQREESRKERSEDREIVEIGVLMAVLKLLGG